jgi:hypothetical protein
MQKSTPLDCAIQLPGPDAPPVVPPEVVPEEAAVPEVEPPAVPVVPTMSAGTQQLTTSSSPQAGVSKGFTTSPGGQAATSLKKHCPPVWVQPFAPVVDPLVAPELPPVVTPDVEPVVTSQPVQATASGRQPLQLQECWPVGHPDVPLVVPLALLVVVVVGTPPEEAPPPTLVAALQAIRSAAMKKRG